mmetsp:Transcript_59749/g.146622  ORF Transcript_59749/g.146622 Transcript_59749/m.146622 type:complete len:230 (+) Transcript_59749:5255-5944(+)
MHPQNPFPIVVTLVLSHFLRPSFEVLEIERSRSQSALYLHCPRSQSRVIRQMTGPISTILLECRRMIPRCNHYVPLPSPQIGLPPHSRCKTGRLFHLQCRIGRLPRSRCKTDRLFHLQCRIGRLPRSQYKTDPLSRSQYKIDRLSHSRCKIDHLHHSQCKIGHFSHSGFVLRCDQLGSPCHPRVVFLIDLPNHYGRRQSQLIHRRLFHLSTRNCDVLSQPHHTFCLGHQ